MHVQLAVDVAHVGVGRAGGDVKRLLDGGGIAALRQQDVDGFAWLGM